MGAKTSAAVVPVLFLAVLSLAGLLGAGGCIDETPRITEGREFPIERLVGIQKGISTRNNVRDVLGEPNKIDRPTDKKEVWHYHSKKEAHHSILWILPNGIDVIEQEVDVVFDGSFVESVDKHTANYTE